MTNCSTGLDQTNPQWGCADDTQCPPLAGFGDTRGPGAGPGYMTGYALIVDLERAYSKTLGATLCVTFPRQEVSVNQGWAGVSGGRVLAHGTEQPAEVTASS